MPPARNLPTFPSDEPPSGTVVVLDAEAGPLGRVWCLYEIWTTIREKGLGALHLLTYGFTNSDIRDCFQVRPPHGL